MNFEFGLYPVVSVEFCSGRSPFYVLEQILEGGAKIVQLRNKIDHKKDVYEQAIIFRTITVKYNARLIINDHIDIALATGADGVHLGQEDLPCSAARNLAPNLIIGVSTHNLAEIKKAETDGATYINIGPIFQTNTKTVSTPPLGLEYLKAAKTSLPFSVMGGIKKDNIVSLLQLGVKNIAMVTEITMAQDISGKTSELINEINRWNSLNL